METAVKRWAGIGFLLFLIAVVTASIVTIMMRYGQGPKSENLPTQLDENASGNAITLTETRDGARQLVIRMQEVQYAQANQLANMTGVQGQVFDKSQKVLLAFEAPKGVYNKVAKHITLSGPAKMTSPANKIAMFAPKISFSANENKIKAEGGVRMVREGMGESRAQRAEFSSDFSHIQLAGHVVSTFGNP